MIITMTVGLIQADSTSIEIKWKSLRNQETVYKAQKNIDLKYYRENLRLKNSSWSGPVTGFLFDEIPSNV